MPNDTYIYNIDFLDAALCLGVYSNGLIGLKFVELERIRIKNSWIFIVPSMCNHN